MRLGKLKNGKAAGGDGITVEMIKGGNDIVVDWIWRLCNMDWISAVIVPLYKGEGTRNEYKSYRGISLLSVVGKIYAVRRWWR